MGSIVPFPSRKPGECCATCLHYVPPPERPPLMLDGPPTSYCRHLERIKEDWPTEDIIRELGLFCDPDHWCHLYEAKARIH